MSTGAAVTVTIEPGSSDDVSVGIEVARSLTSAQPTQVVKPFRTTMAKIKELSARLRQELDLLRDSFGSGESGTPDTAGRMLQGLHIAGANTVDELFGETDGDRWRRVLATALSTATLDRPLLLELKHVQGFGFPLELIPITPPRLASPPSSIHELRALAGAFPVFTCVVRRILLDAASSLSQEGELYAAPELTAVVFWNETSPGTADDVRYLRERLAEGSMRLAGPIPGAAFERPSDAAAQVLAGQLVRPPTFRTSNWPGEDIPYQVVQISAHSRADLPGVTNATVLYLGKLATRKNWITKPEEHVYEIGGGRLLYTAKALGEPMPHGPVGLLSSCYGTTSAEQGMLGLVVPLLRAGYRCVVGFDAAVPGSVATTLFTYTYSQLLRGVRLGEALSRAQSWLLLNKCNPLGLLMRSYGRTDLLYRGGTREWERP